MKEVIAAAQAPAALGPYSQGIKTDCGRLIFCSGQIGLDPHTGELVSDQVTDQARRVMENLKVVLAAGGAGFADVVKTTIYLTDIADFSAVNEVYAAYFSDLPPARATIECSRLPKEARVEIEALAVVG